LQELLAELGTDCGGFSEGTLGVLLSAAFISSSIAALACCAVVGSRCRRFSFVCRFVV